MGESVMVVGVFFGKPRSESELEDQESLDKEVFLCRRGDAEDLFEARPAAYKVLNITAADAPTFPAVFEQLHYFLALLESPDIEGKSSSLLVQVDGF